MPRFVRVAAVLVLAALAGACGKTEPTEGPKPSLSEDEKQQVNDLKEQRQKEWNSTKKGQGK